MNTLLVLVLATSPAADPQPLPVGPATPPPIILVSESEWSEPMPQQSQPRFLGKVRNYISRKWTQISDKVTGNTPMESTERVTVQTETSNGITRVQVVPATTTPRTTRAVWTDSSPEPPLADPVQK